MTENGAAVEEQQAPEVEFPLDSFKEAAHHLRRPFTPQAVKFKVQATWPKDEPQQGLIVAYIDARLAVERLNLIVPHLWGDEYEGVGGSGLLCHLTVDGITRRDVGEGYKGKGLYSDALKRAAVKFGVGVSLYAIPKIVLKVSDGHLRKKQDGKVEITANGEERCRKIYEMWLDTRGRQAFGEPLDHGDVEDAQGDTEDGEPPAVDTETGEVETKNTASLTTPATASQKTKVTKLLKDNLSDEAGTAVWRWGQTANGKLSRPRAAQIIDAFKEETVDKLVADAGYSEVPADTEGLEEAAEEAHAGAEV